MLICKRLCLVLRRQMDSCVFWPSIPESVKLEVGNARRRMKAHISGAKDVLYLRELPAVGTGR